MNQREQYEIGIGELNRDRNRYQHQPVAAYSIPALTEDTIDDGPTRRFIEPRGPRNALVVSLRVPLV